MEVAEERAKKILASIPWMPGFRVAMIGWQSNRVRARPCSCMLSLTSLDATSSVYVVNLKAYAG
jgi:hypothetical protein